MEFPRLVYRSASSHLLVQDEAAHKQALKDGWHDSVPEATGEAEVVAAAEQAADKQVAADAKAAEAKQAASQKAADAANVKSKAVGKKK